MRREEARREKENLMCNIIMVGKELSGKRFKDKEEALARIDAMSPGCSSLYI